MCVCICMYIYTYIYIVHFLYSLICWWALGLFSYLDYCKQHCSEHWGTYLFSNQSVHLFWIYAQGVELLAHMVALFLAFLRNFCTVLHSGCIKLFSYQQCRRFLFSPRSLPHLWFVQFFIIAILTGGRQYLMLLICISLILSNVEHLFPCLLAICMSSSVKCLFSSYTHLLFIYLFNIELYGTFVYFGY